MGLCSRLTVFYTYIYTLFFYSPIAKWSFILSLEYSLSLFLLLTPPFLDIPNLSSLLELFLLSSPVSPYIYLRTDRSLCRRLHIYWHYSLTLSPSHFLSLFPPLRSAVFFPTYCKSKLTGEKLNYKTSIFHYLGERKNFFPKRIFQLYITYIT